MSSEWWIDDGLCGSLYLSGEARNGVAVIWTRRGLIKSLSRTALVLTLEDVLKLAIPAVAQEAAQQVGARPSYDTKARPAPKGTASPVAGTPLGYSFVDVAKQSGLTTKTIYGGEHKNRYLLETTGCGVAFYDFDHDDWLDLFLVNGTRLEGFCEGLGAGESSVQEQSGWHVYGYYGEEWDGAVGVGAGMLRRGL